MIDKLYHIVYCSLVNQDGRAARASNFLSAAIVWYIAAIYFFSIVITKSQPPQFLPVLLSVPAVSIAYGMFWYFVKTGRHEQIIEKHGRPEQMSQTKIILYRIFSIGLLFLGSLASFVYSGITLGRYLYGAG